MRKTTWLIIMSFLVMTAFSAGLNAQAQGTQQTKKLGIGINGGYAIFSDDQLDGGVSVGLSVLYNFTKALRVELKGSYEKSAAEYSADGLYGGDLTSTALMLSLQYQFELSPKFKPYLGAGVGYYLNSFVVDDGLTWITLGFNIEDEVDSVVGFHFGLGADFFLNPSFALNLDARYCIASLKGTYTITGITSGISNSGDIEGDLNHIVVGAGIKYMF